jgi:alpha-glucosidase
MSNMRISTVHRRREKAVFGLLTTVLFLGSWALWSPGALAQAPRVKYQSGNRYLIVEFLDDDLVHLELSALGPGPDVSTPIPTTPMIHRTDYAGPSSLLDDGAGTLETPEVRVQVDPKSLCVTVTDLSKDPALVLTTLCPHNLDQAWKGIRFTPEGFTHAYGLGQEFITPQSSEGDWVGRIRSPGSEMGNALIKWNGGAVGNTQFPILYLAGEGNDSYALFADNAYRQRWDLTGNPWTAEMEGDWLRFYLMTGPDLPDLRGDYMELVGHALVPPKAMFGLWVSEYGFDNWDELDDKLRTLRANHFPVDGMVLDLQWFGGFEYGSDDSPAGSLTWDLAAFPEPEIKISALQKGQGVGIVLIEHAYISKNLPAHAEMERQGYLVRECESCPATYLDRKPYLGKGGMIDWSNDAAGAYWHDRKRAPLIAAGIVGHWTDLGEPLTYNDWAWYQGSSGDHEPLHAHADVHNLYNLAWSRSIYEGYLRDSANRRPYILSRSGAPGSQRYGVSMWSGDIGSNLSSLATHLNAQMHMSMSGMDYYGADIGGFYRDALDGDLDEMYTQWFANGMAFDIPARTHTENLCNCRETAPDRVGDLQSNLENVRQRYALSPYLYSLAHRAYLYGEPVIPPLVYYYQSDPNVREMGHEKLLGRDLLVAIVAAHGEAHRHVYLPAGDWVDYTTRQRYHSIGQWFGPFPVYVDGHLKLPTFARAGAILPQMYVDEKTMNVTGRRSDGSTHDELIVQVFPDEKPNSFTLYEDDGRTLAYRDGAVRTTLLSQIRAGNSVTVTIGAATGAYTDALTSRDNVVTLVVGPGVSVFGVALDGVRLPQVESQTAFDAAGQAWYRAGDGLVVARSGEMVVSLDKRFVFDLGRSTYLPRISNER